MFTCDVIFKTATFCRRRVTQVCRPTQRAKLFGCARDKLFSTLACACSRVFCRLYFHYMVFSSYLVLPETHEFRRFPVCIYVMALWYYIYLHLFCLVGLHIKCHFQGMNILSSPSDASLSPTQCAKLFGCACDKLFSTLACACSVLLKTHEFRRFPVYIYVMALWYYIYLHLFCLAGVDLWCHFQAVNILSSSSDARLSAHPARKTFCLCPRQFIFDARLCMFSATQDTRVPTFFLCIFMSCNCVIV